MASTSGNNRYLGKREVRDNSVGEDLGTYGA